MKYILLLVLALVSCQDIEHSQEMYEEGRVTYMKHTPQHTVVYPTVDYEGELTIETKTIPEKYVIGFSCEHGGFKIEGNTAEELFYQFREGDEVIITYRQMDAVVKKDGKEVERHFYDWDFVTANKLNRDGPKESN